MSDAVRQLHLRGATGATHIAQYEGRDHYVVPVTALVEGVIHAVNAPHPEFVPFSTLSSNPYMWNGRPAVLGHPVVNGAQVSANEPKILEQYRIGSIFNARVEGKQLRMDVYVDPARLETLGTERALKMLEMLKKNEPIEVSVGSFTQVLPEQNSFNGKSYKARWMTMASDHIAFLPMGVGACSLEMGCGANRAAEQMHLITAEGHIELITAGGPGSGWTAENGHVAGAHSAAVSAHLAASDRHIAAASKLRETPDATSTADSLGKVTEHSSAVSRTADATAATKATGSKPYAAQAAKAYSKMASQKGSVTNGERAKYHEEAAKMHIAAATDHANAAKWASPKEKMKGAEMSEERRTLRERLTALITAGFRAADTPVELAAEEKAELIGYQTMATLFDSLQSSLDSASSTCDDLISDEVDQPTLTAEDEAAEEEVECARLDSIESFALTMYSHLSSILDQTRTLRRKALDTTGDPARYAAGARHSAADVAVIQGVHDQSVKLGADCGAMKAASAHAGCGCGGGSMTKEARTAAHAAIMTAPGSAFTDIKVLEAMSDDAITALEKTVKTSTDNAVKVSALETKITALESKKLTTEEFMAVAPPEIKTLLEKTKQKDELHKTELVATLKAAQSVYTEEQLKLKNLEQLEEIALLVKVEVAPADYSGRAVPRAAADGTDVYANPPNPYSPEAIKAHQARFARS